MSGYVSGGCSTSVERVSEPGQAPLPQQNQPEDCFPTEVCPGFEAVAGAC